MLCSDHLCIFMEEIFIINIYGSEKEKKILNEFLRKNNAGSLKDIITIAGKLRGKIKK